MKDIIELEIKRFVNNSEHNRLTATDKPYFIEPLIGYADALDPLFTDYKEIIGDFHLTPAEFFAAEFGVSSFAAGTVISWILPINREIIESNRLHSRYPSREWAHTRYFGEMFNNKLREHLQKFFSSKGFRAVAPSISKEWSRVHSERTGLASTWSERHAAYACGLGTFSLNDALITEKGIAHRCGSIIVEAKLAPTPRVYQGPYEYCLYCTSKKCGACIKRCPAGAITEKGHDKEKCFNYTRNEVYPVYNKEYGVGISGCGLCQTKVPCEQKIP
ncbi:4Fe-4S double cluster binding domain-containing protein [Dethiobacter alkaliphilus]|uniref:4Fe-4S ferredoxin, iron-sulfur binding domain protein n=1 Tax=Dethiobacter alkaliphilus AHT 1 TaxID=555088 RepID=C0GCH9_DETAL|nr:(Fe-S)-binding protein [Dethiobacter alkaliphilus]EEG78914.1 4Fe-4S ferredoxin, iron-sulfur binding domain protein [Dethiobacter alkaliphilus AHT 1]